MDRFRTGFIVGSMLALAGGVLLGVGLGKPAGRGAAELADDVGVHNDAFGPLRVEWSARQPVAARPVWTKWQYFVLDSAGEVGRRREDVQAYLQTYGDAGWELMLPPLEGRLVFRRPLREEPIDPK